jgi:hypothetical protein
MMPMNQKCSICLFIRTYVGVIDVTVAGIQVTKYGITGHNRGKPTLIKKSCSAALF